MVIHALLVEVRSRSSFVLKYYQGGVDQYLIVKKEQTDVTLVTNTWNRVLFQLPCHISGRYQKNSWAFLSLQKPTHTNTYKTHRPPSTNNKNTTTTTTISISTTITWNLRDSDFSLRKLLSLSLSNRPQFNKVALSPKEETWTELYEKILFYF